MTEFLHSLSHLPPAWLYLVIYLIAFIENVFPPTPSDIVIVFGGALAAMNHGNIVIALACATVGSTFGFMTMYIIGSWLGTNFIERREFKHFPKESLHQVERWFAKYGVWIIIVNRFLAGTRAVVSLFAGLSQLDFRMTTILSFVSSLAWYTILVFSGYSLGRHWQKVGGYIETYSMIFSIVVTAIIIVALGLYLWKRRGKPA